MISRIIRNILVALVTALMPLMASSLERTTPEMQGVPSRAVEALFDSLTLMPDVDIHSVMVLRHGKVIGEIYPQPFAPQYRHTVYSVSKTFTAAAVGIAIGENRLRLTDRVAAFFPELLPDSISMRLAQITVEDLLTMRSGIIPDRELRNHATEWRRAFLAKNIDGVPGSSFNYDSLDSYMLSAIVQRVVGTTTFNYLNDHVFRPMDITDIAWEQSPEGISTGGWGVYATSESLAKFGQLLLQRGCWNGRQLIPAEWVDQMMSLHVPEQGYGYHMWQCEDGTGWRADGAFGQYIMVFPSHDMVVVVTECANGDHRRERALVWNTLFPHLADGELPPSDDSRRLLKRQNQYVLPYPEGKKTGLARLLPVTIKLDANRLGFTSLNISRNADGTMMLRAIDSSGKVTTARCGYRKWGINNNSAFPPYNVKAIGRFSNIDRNFAVAGAYAWPDGRCLRLTLHYVNWITRVQLEVKFVDDANVKVTISQSTEGKPYTVHGTIVR
ncbi:MAG: serine hydrolase domain-containing protein [Muribaculaceae bacterium]